MELWILFVLVYFSIGFIGASLVSAWMMSTFEMSEDIAIGRWAITVTVTFFLWWLVLFYVLVYYFPSLFIKKRKLRSEAN